MFFIYKRRKDDFIVSIPPFKNYLLPNVPHSPHLPRVPFTVHLVPHLPRVPFTFYPFHRVPFTVYLVPHSPHVPFTVHLLPHSPHVPHAPTSLFPFAMITTAPNIRTIPIARLRVKGSLKTKMPMRTAVRGSRAPSMAVAVEPTYLAA